MIRLGAKKAGAVSTQAKLSPVARFMQRIRVGSRSDAGVLPHTGAAAVAARSATLLRGGVAAGRVFALLAEQSHGDRQLHALAEAMLRGATGSEALALLGAGSDANARGERNRQGGEGAQWRLLAVAWGLAEHSGAPLAPALERIAEAFRAVAKLQERRTVLLSGPRATVRLVAILPLLALLLSALLGFDPFPVLMSPIGALLVTTGVLLLTLGIAWAEAMVRRVEREDRPAGVELELMCISLGGGAAPDTAMLRLADTVDAVRADWVRFADLCRGSALRSTLDTAAATGIGATALLTEEAAACRSRSFAALEREAERLGVRVLVPLGCCVLPSFIALGVLPVMLSMLGGVS